MKHGKKYKWHKIANSISELGFGENHLAEITVAGKKICVAKAGDTVAACTASCPHAGGNMSEGFLDNKGNIVCPVHGYVFSFTNGRDLSGEGYVLKIYPVKVNEDGVFIGIEEGSLLGWLR